MEQKTAHGRYEELARIREPYLRRARDGAAVTLPYLFPPEGASGSTDLPTPFQSVGARGVNNLASKLLLALLPPNTPFFQLQVDDFALAELGDAEQEDLRGKIDSALASVARAVQQQVEKSTVRKSAFEALKNLLVGGNVLVEILKDDRWRVHQMHKYVVLRDGEGRPLDIILKEVLSLRALKPELRALVPPTSVDDQKAESVEETIDLFTWIRREPTNWNVHQEIGNEGTVVPDSHGTYPLDRVPWNPLRFVQVDGEHWGRGHVEEYLGDLFSLERSSQAVIEVGAEASKIRHFVDPGGETDIDEFVDMDNGAAIEGRAADVTTHELGKFYDFRITDAVMIRLEDRLEQAFLLMSGIQRNAERVTAEEIRRLAEELEQALGGIYSLLADELQAPLVRVLMHQNKKLPKLPKDVVNLRVVTGMAALGRNHDLVKLDSFFSGAAETFGPDVVAEYTNVGAYLERRAAALNLPVDGMIRDEASVQQARQQRQLTESLQQAGPAMVNAMSEQAAARTSQQTQE